MEGGGGMKVSKIRSKVASKVAKVKAKRSLVKSFPLNRLVQQMKK